MRSILNSNQRLKQVLFAFCLFFTASVVSIDSVSAQATPAESIVMSPSSRSYKINAGSAISDELTVINDGSTGYDFIVYTRPYSVNDESYVPNFTTDKANADAYQWVQIPKTKFHLDAGKSTKVSYSIAAPTNAAPGGHYGVVFVETQPTPEQEKGNAVIRKKRVGSIIYATVNGTYTNEGAPVGSTIPFWQPQPPLRTTVSVKNTGNTDFLDTTQLTVKDIFGNLKYDAKKDYPVLPQTTRKIELNWNQASWFGLYNVETSQTILGKTTKNNGYVLIMPRYLPVIVVIVIIIGGVYAWFRNRKK